MSLNLVLISALAVWMLAGIFWLYPKKRALLRRVGNVSNDQLIHLAKSGDAEALKLHKFTKFYIAVGLLVVLPLALLGQVLKGSI